MSTFKTASKFWWGPAPPPKWWGPEAEAATLPVEPIGTQPSSKSQHFGDDSRFWVQN